LEEPNGNRAKDRSKPEDEAKIAQHFVCLRTHHALWMSALAFLFKKKRKKRKRIRLDI